MDEILKINSLKDDPEFRKLEKAAYFNALDISEFPPEKYKYFSKLREISVEYQRSSQTEADKKRLNELKNKYFGEYEQAIEKSVEYCERCLQQQEYVRRSEKLRIEITKATDSKTKLDLALKCISAMLGDADAFYSANKEGE